MHTTTNGPLKSWQSRQPHPLRPYPTEFPHLTGTYQRKTVVGHIFSSSFAHNDVVHLGINILVLWGLGRFVVRGFGVPRFVVLWVFSLASPPASHMYWEHTLEKLRRETVGRRWDKREVPKILGIHISRKRTLAMSGGSGAFERRYAGFSGVDCSLTGPFLCLNPTSSIRLFVPFPLPFHMALWLAELIFATGTVFCMATGHSPNSSTQDVWAGRQLALLTIIQWRGPSCGGWADCKPSKALRQDQHRPYP